MIDHDKLRELASDPNNKSKDIRDALGFKNDAALHYQLNKDAEAKKIYSERASAKGGNVEGTVSARAPRRSSKRAPKTDTPPRNGHANGRVSDELLRRIKHEFEHISLYDEKTDYFDEILEQVRIIK